MKKYYLLGIIITVAAVFMFVASDALAQGVPQAQDSFYQGDPANNPIVEWINFFITVFSTIIITGATILVIVGGIQYTAARDNPQAVQAAKQRIFNTVLGLGAYFIFYAFVQWIIPGGAF